MENKWKIGGALRNLEERIWYYRIHIPLGLLSSIYTYNSIFLKLTIFEYIELEKLEVKKTWRNLEERVWYHCIYSHSSWTKIAFHEPALLHIYFHLSKINNIQYIEMKNWRWLEFGGKDLIPLYSRPSWTTLLHIYI